MKKITILAFVLLAFVSYNSIAQTIVGTSPENKNAILEEYTGIKCVNCPSGHAIANDIKEAKQDDFYIINVHVGSYANPSPGQPDFRTPFGTALANQSGLTGYPMGSINRHVFTGSTTALGRGSWSSAANNITNQSSYVNVGVEASIDAVTKLLTVHVEGYYTGDSPVATNYFNVALNQNNTLGPQTGGGMGNNYNHQHRLVHMVTGQWGDPINTTTTGSFIDRTYTYTLPANYNGIPTDIADFEIVAFITESHQEIITASGARPTYTGVTGNELEVVEVSGVLDNCSGMYTPKIKVYNNGGTEFTSLDITYSINGAPDTVYTWNGLLPTYHTEYIEIPNLVYNELSLNTINVSFPDDDDLSDNAGTTSFDPVVLTTGTTINVELKPDNYGSETTWEVINVGTGAVLLSGGPYTDSNNTVIYDTVTVLQGQCLAFKIMDEFGDGIDAGYGVGYYKVFSGTDLLVQGGNFGSEEQKGFNTPNVATAGDNIFAQTSVYPNPANTQINITNVEGFSIELFDLLGRKVFVKENSVNNETINVANFTNGTYILKLSNGEVSKTEKVVILK